jgi:hypothetical protein
MTDVEDRLRRHLAEQAAAAHPRSDLDDLTQRLARGTGRRRAVVVVGVCAALVVGGIGGFAIGRSEVDDGDDVVAAEDPTSEGPAPDATTTPPDPVPVPTMPPGEAPGAVEGGAGDAVPVTTIAPSGVLTDEARAFVGPGYELDLLTTRTTATGDVLRLYQQPPWAPGDDGNPFWDAPATCMAVSSVTAEWSTDLAVGTAWATVYEEPRDGLVASATPVGVAEGVPAIVVLAQVGPDVHEVTATFPGGAVDTTNPIDGLAVLAAPAPGLDAEAGYEGTSLGVVVTTDTGLVDDDVAAYGFDMYGASECQVPTPSLPEPGEQPADPEAARAAVEAAWTGLHDRSLTVDERGVHLQGGAELLAPIEEQLLAGGFADQVRQAEVPLDDLVFTAPDEAWVLYHIEIGGSPSFSGRFGHVLLIDGVWLVTTESYCRDVALAGVACPAE